MPELSESCPLLLTGRVYYLKQTEEVTVGITYITRNRPCTLLGKFR